MILRGEHLTSEGQCTIAFYKSGFLQGLSEKLKETFPKVSENPIIYNPKIGDLNGHQIAGFTNTDTDADADADGSFFLGVRNMSKMRQRRTGQARPGQAPFSISQYVRDR